MYRKKYLNKMMCEICKENLVESNLESTFEEESKTFYKEYYCFGCNTLYVCHSQSGDFIQEYLEKVEL